jgi:acetylglutamate kinase
VAGAIAGALSAEKFLLLIDVSGVKNKNDELITTLPMGSWKG